MSPRPRILVVSAFVPPAIGGVESFCRWLGEALPAEVEFLSCAGPGVASRWQVPCRTVAGWPVTLPTRAVRRTIADAVRWSDGVLIQNTMHAICAMASRAATDAGRPARTVVHALVGSSTARALRPAARAYHRLVARRTLADAPPVALAHVIAEAVERDMGVACPVAEFPMAPGALRPPLGPPAPGAPFHVLFAGRFAREKAPDDAAAACRALGGRVRLTLMGEGPMAARLRAEGDGTVAFRPPGDPAAVASAMRRAHLVLVPSRREASGLVVLEALGLGCPVVATRVGDIPRHVGDEALPTLTAEAGDRAGLETSLRAVIDDYGAWERWARRRAEEVRVRHDPRHAVRLLMGSLGLGR